MSGLFARFSALIIRARWVVLGIWLVIVATCGLMALQTSSVLKAGGFEIPNSEAGRAARLLQDEFNRNDYKNVILVYHSDTLTTDQPAFRDAVQKTLDAIKPVPNVKATLSYLGIAGTRLVSADKHSTYALVSMEGTDTVIQAQVPALREAVKGTALEVHVAGTPALYYDTQVGVEDDLHRAEFITLPLVLIALLVVFGTLVAAALPIVLAAAAVATTLAILFVIGSLTDVSIYSLNIASMLGLGLSIDFSLLVVSRFREELARGLDTRRAVINTMVTAGRSITFSGLTVAAAMFVLTFFDLMVLRSMALSILLVALVSVIVGMTLLPAILALLGHRVDALRVLRGRGRAGANGSTGQATFWRRWAGQVMARPWLWLAISLAVLLFLAVPALQLDTRAPGIEAVPGRSDSRQGFNVLDKAFGNNEFYPIQIIVDTGKANGAWQTTVKDGIYQLSHRLQADNRVARVDSLATLLANETRAQMDQITPQLARTRPEVGDALGRFVNWNQDSSVTLVSAVVREPVQSRNIRDLVTSLRADILPSIAGLKGASIYVGGTTAGVMDFDAELYGQFPYLAAGMMALIFLILVLFFNSLVLPVKALILNVLSILASYGALVTIFQWGWGHDMLGFEPLGALTILTPLVLFAVVFGLSTDYEVFLLSRVKEYWYKTGSNQQSVAFGVEKTGGIISAAALIMVAVFTAFSTAEIIVIKEIGLGLLVSIVLDATLIRLVAVPAAMRLLGRWNWYMPAWLRRIVPEIKEHPELEETPAPEAAKPAPEPRRISV